MGVKGDEFPLRSQGAAPLVGFGAKPQENKEELNV